MSDSMRVIGAGMKAIENRLDVISGNLANANTPGYRRSAGRMQLFETALETEMGGSTRRLPHETTVIDFTQGKISNTQNALDVAIDGKGFFEVKHDDGSFGYTRNGRFTRDPQGRLSLPGGLNVMGAGGPIVVPDAGKLVIAIDGTVRSGEEMVGTIKLVDFARPEALTRGPRGTLSAGPEAVIQGVDNPRMIQGSYEGSNVEATHELVSLIEAQRSYERKNRAIKMISEASAALMRAAQG